MKKNITKVLSALFVSLFLVTSCSKDAGTGTAPTGTATTEAKPAKTEAKPAKTEAKPAKTEVAQDSE